MATVIRVQPLKCAIPGEPDAFVYVSARWAANADNTARLEPMLSFVVMGATSCAEWEPRCGPIALFFKGDDQEHYTFQRIRAPHLDWSQRAVEDRGLQSAFVRGDVAYICGVLREWVESHPARGDEPTEGTAHV